MRKLMWFTLGFAAACALCAYMLPAAGIAACMIWAGVLSVFLGILSRRVPAFARITVLLLGCAAGLGWFHTYDRLYLQTAAELDGQTRPFTVRSSDYGQASGYGSWVEGTVELDGRPYDAIVYLDTNRAVSPGDRFTASFRCRVTTSHGEEGATYHQGKGIFLLLYQAGDTVAFHPGEISRWDLPVRLRRSIGDLLSAAFPADTAPFAKALLLGDTSQLGYETDTDLKISGIRHVAAVSGLHVSILFSLISAVAFRKRFLTALISLPVLLLFAAVAGFTPSVTRACLMSALMLAAPLFRKTYDGATALSFAALVILAINPLSITNAGFQLSVASVAGIYLFSSGIQEWIRSFFGKVKGRTFKGRLIGWFSGSVSVSLSAMPLTVPLCAWYFGTVSLVGVLTNLLTLWIITFIFYGLISVCLVGWIWQSAAVILGALLSVPIRYVLLVAKIMAHLPLSAVYTRSPYIVVWLVFVYLLLGIFLISKYRQPWQFAACAVLGLSVALLASWWEPLKDDVRLTVLDVGQGQCLLLQSRGQTYMVDCGGDRDSETADTAAETLLSQGISRLDGLILTHLDRDHAGAAEELLSRIDTDLLILPPESSRIPGYTDGQVVYGAEDLELTFEGTKLYVFSADDQGDSNEKSLCVLFDTEKCDILITGDRNFSGEEALLRSSRVGDVDVLIAGHHGSQYATSPALLNRTQPETVCISVGRDNLYGHPAGELLTRLKQFGCSVYRTDIHGDIIIRR